MKKIIVTSLKGWLIFSVICGVLYTTVVTVIGQVAFSEKVNGSLITEKIDGDNVIVGSKLIGQTFSEDKYLQGRPQEVSQLSPVSQKQQINIEKRVEQIDQKNIPIDLVTASASGVDPDISQKSAYFQAERIAQARGISIKEVQKIIEKNTISGFLESKDFKRVNVLAVNLSLDELK